MNGTSMDNSKTTTPTRSSKTLKTVLGAIVIGFPVWLANSGVLTMPLPKWVAPTLTYASLICAGIAAVLGRDAGKTSALGNEALIQQQARQLAAITQTIAAHIDPNTATTPAETAAKLRGDAKAVIDSAPTVITGTGDGNGIPRNGS